MMDNKKGIIYIMTTAVPGLIKIGKTGSSNFTERMRFLEQNGYRNITALKKAFAIEVDDYETKEVLLHTIFEKSRVSDTELFALDKDVAVQLLTSFEGTVIHPETETKKEIFTEATENTQSKLIPDGIYTFKRTKQSDNNKTVHATAEIKNGKWTLLKGSVLGMTEDKGVSQKAKEARAKLQINSDSGELLKDFELEDCAPSHAGTVVMNQSSSGWTDWRNKHGQPIDIYRQYDKESD